LKAAGFWLEDCLAGPKTGALHNLPHHYYVGFTHFWQLGTGIEISKAL
jgi:hypothetical protein